MNEEWESVRPRWLEQIRMERPSVGNNGPSGRNRTDSSGRLFFRFLFSWKKMAATGAGKQITRRVFIFVDYCFFFFFFGRVSFHSTVDGLTVFFFCFRFVRSFCVISLSLSLDISFRCSRIVPLRVWESAAAVVWILYYYYYFFQVFSFFFSILGLLFAVIVLVGWIASDCRPSEGGET